MSFINRLFQKKPVSRRTKLIRRQRLAWFLIVCIGMATINGAVFATGEGWYGGLEASPSSAASASDADVLMPGETVTGDELLVEAERAVTAGHKFDFYKMLKLTQTEDSEDDGDEDRDVNRRILEKYEDLFKGHDAFVLFYDNGKSGRLVGDDEKAFGYILVRLADGAYKEYLDGEGRKAATPSDLELYEEDVESLEEAKRREAEREASASDADYEGGYQLRGDEEIIFLYINGTEEDITYALNLEDIESSDVIVPSVDSIGIKEEEAVEETKAAVQEEETAKGEDGEKTEDAGSQTPGGENGGSGGISGGGGSGSGSGGSGSSDSGDSSGSGTDSGSKDEDGNAGGGTTAGDSSQDSDGGKDTGKDKDSGSTGNGGTASGSGDVSDSGTGSAGGNGTAGGNGGTSGGSASGESDQNKEEDKKTDDGKTDDKADGTGNDKTDSGEPDNNQSSAGDKADAGDKTVSGDSGKTENADSDKGSSDKGSADKGGTSDKGGTGDKTGGSDSGKTESGSTGKDTAGDKADSGGSGQSEGSASGKTDSGSSKSENSKSDSGSGSSGSSKSDSGSDSSKDSGKVVKSGSFSEDSGLTLSISRNLVPTVMGPNPDATGEEDEDDMSFEEWQDMMDELEEEEEDDYDSDYDSDSYDYSDDSYDEEDGIIRLNMSALPTVVAEVKSNVQRRSRIAFFGVAEPETQRVALAASKVALTEFKPFVRGYHKQIEHTGGDQYKLYLDLSGRQALDVLLVIDLSNSMALDWNGYDAAWNSPSRLSKVKAALNGENGSAGFIEQILDPTYGGDSKNRLAIVTYGTTAAVKQINNTGTVWSNSIKNIEDTVSNLAANQGGTNYEDGLVNAESALDLRGETDNIPVVVFLSDGYPTFFNVDKGEATWRQSGYNSYWDFNYGNDKTASYGERVSPLNSKDGYRYTNDSYWRSGVGGTGVIGDLEKDKKTQNESKHAGDSFYTNRSGPSAETSNSKAVIFTVGFGEINNFTYLNHIAYGSAAGNEPEIYGGRVLVGADPLRTTFDEILKRIKFNDVVISDTLSEYVDFDDPLDAKVEKKRAFGADSWTKVNEAAITREGKTITAKLAEEGNDNYTLDPLYQYRLSFNIKVNETAKKYYREHGYPHTGMSDTDHNEEKITSTDRPGFFSNTEATLEFGFEDSRIQLAYPKPVVQVPYEPEHRKYIEDKKDGTYELTLDVTSRVETSETITQVQRPADIVFVVDRTSSMEDAFVKDSRNTKKAAVNSAMAEVVADLKGKENVYYTCIQFANTTANDAWEVLGTNTWKSTKDAYPNAMNISQTAGFTMPRFGLQKGIQRLQTGSPGNRDKEDVKKILIFLTDGVPECLNPWNRYNQLSKEFYRASMTEEIGVLDTYLDALDFPITAYLIGCGIDTSNDSNKYGNNSPKYTSYSYMNALSDNIRNRGGENTVVYADTAQAVKEAFENIGKELGSSETVSTAGVKGTVITDTLSEYAEFTNPDATDDVEILMDEQSMPDAERQKARPNIQKNGKTITVAFDKDYELSKDVTYSIRFPVKPSEKAYEDYAVDSNYGGTKGDLNTDVPGMSEAQHTSSDKAGFYSNKEADLTYTMDGSENTLEYPKPVLQVKQGKLRIRKVVDGQKPGDVEEQQFIIHVNGGDFVSLPLYDGELSPYIYVTDTGELVITESVPIEYTQESELVIINANTNRVIDRTADGRITVKPGDNLIVEVHNTFAHEGYFHGKAAVTNYTTGDQTAPFQDVPFQNSREAAQAIADNQEKAALLNDEDDAETEVNSEESETLD